MYVFEALMACSDQRCGIFCNYSGSASCVQVTDYEVGLVLLRNLERFVLECKVDSLRATDYRSIMIRIEVKSEAERAYFEDYRKNHKKPEDLPA